MSEHKIPEVAPPGYVWGVFKDESGTYVDHYFKEMTYPTLVKGQMTREQAIEFFISFTAKKETEPHEGTVPVK